MAVWVRVPLAVQKIIGMKQILIELSMPLFRSFEGYYRWDCI